MSETIWLILINIFGTLTYFFWFFIGLQFCQISGVYKQIRRRQTVVFIFISMIILIACNIGLAYFGSRTLIECITIVSIYLLIIFACKVLYKRSVFQVFKVFVMMICLSGMVAVLQVVYYMGLTHIQNMIPTYVLLIMHQITTIASLILSGGILRKLFIQTDWQGKKFPWRIIPQCCCLLIFSVILIFSQSYLVFFLKGGMILLVCGWTAILITGFFTIDLYGIRERHDQISQELSVYRKQAELRYAYYQELEEKYNDSRKLIHDIKNHLHAIEGLHEKGETDVAEEYTREIHGMLNKLSKKYYCDNRMLNIILSDKIENAQRLGIKVSVKIGEMLLDSIKDVDITTIFANLLDNAVTAASSQKEPWISISVREVHDFLVIVIKNAAAPKNSYEVKERRKHGIGLKNVKITVERYNGTLETRQEEKLFRVNIVIPLEVK